MFALRTFGTLSLAYNGSIVEPLASQRKALAVLTILATDGPVSRDRLMALLWPESEIDRARGSLKQAIHTLRHLLGAPDIVQGRVTLELNASLIDSDVAQFRRAIDAGDLALALSLYRGEFLDGIHLNGSSEIEQWVDNRRAVLRSAYRQALEQLARQAASSGSREESVRFWSRLAGHDPLDGKVALHLMQALEAMGQRAAAIRHAQAHEEAMLRELGMAPDKEIVSLAAQLRSSAPPAPAPPSAGAGRTRGPAEESPSPGFAEPIRRPAWLRRAALAGLTVVLAGLVIMASRRAQAPGVTGDENLIAIGPFDVLDPSLELWGEGLMDMLAQDLDGSGPLRTVQPAVAVQHWKGEASRTAADELGRRTGAGGVIYGRIVKLGRDSVNIRASLLDRSSGNAATDLFDLAGPQDRIGELVDSLGIQVIRVLGRERPIGAQRRVSIGSRSFPALKEFLRGEQFYRTGRFDSALVHYDLAIQQDSTFALALRRMAWTLGYGALTANRYSPQREYFQRAALSNHGLSPRDSALLQIDSILVYPSTDPDRILADRLRIFRSLEALARRYPDDPSIWFELGEQRYHYGEAMGLSREALEAFDRSIAIDSGFAPAYAHTLRLAIELGRTDQAIQYARRYDRLHTTDPGGPAIALAGRILEAGGVRDSGLWKQVREAAGITLIWNGMDHFTWLVDSGETTVAILRELTRGTHDMAGAPPFAENPSTWQEALAAALVFRGHLRAGAAEKISVLRNERAGAPRVSNDRFLDLAIWKILPDTTVARLFDQALDPGSRWDTRPVFLPPRFLLAPAWWLATRDTVSLSRFVRRAREVERSNPDAIAILRARYVARAGDAYLSLLRGDSSAAISQLTAIPDSGCILGLCFQGKLTLARLLAARGDLQLAAEIYDRWRLADGNSSFAVLAALEHAQVLERLGERETSRQRFQFVIDAWRAPDPELRPYVQAARDGLRRLAAPR